MLSFHIILIAIGIIQSIVLTIAMFGKKNDVNSTHKWLIALCILLTISLVEGVIEITELDTKFPHLSLIILPINGLFLPLYYAYISDMVGGKRKGSLLVHFTPSLLLFLMISPMILLDSNFLLELLNGDAQDTYFDMLFFLTLLLFFTVVIVQGSYYIPACFRLLADYKTLIFEQLSFNEKISLTWLKAITSGIAIIWCLLIITLLTGELFSDKLPIALHVISALLVISLNIFGLQQINIFKKLRIDIHDLVDNKATNVKNKKYQRSSLNSELAETLCQSTLKFMEREKPYLNNELSLSSLAEALDLSPHNLSQIINQETNKNFFEFINSYRVQFAKQLLLNCNDTVLKIAMDSGFNSKTTFYNAFKKDTSMSPSEYRQRNKKS
ncbi:helix-turn-helix transcriptional regulator [Thalassotalea sp. 1_MG-2023]|uniref:helix-turn-helix domain-containing protein n=1 Tax=Thalassotalea sp. 1_MG-2023 TaxID=3062680 RepID=UPI0026E40504|nr:response regulator transcription factor [Thalassotalea sp. 1_MG-2023]MDO6427680.1 helix-turn-helix transcriptional regulator [Thalassotalea sp. 1_MG-2023]